MFELNVHSDAGGALAVVASALLIGFVCWCLRIKFE